MSASQHPIPATPRVISPSPTPSDQSAKDGSFTRSISPRLGSPEAISEESEPVDADLLRARSKSRSPAPIRRSPRRTSGGKTDHPAPTSIRRTGSHRKSDHATKSASTASKRKNSDGHLKPTLGFGAEYWRQLSRSPSPLGLIPIHRDWRIFIHKHEIPRKALHVSIGFVTLGLYLKGSQLDDIHPVMMKMLIPVGLLDVIRMNYEPFNRIYINVMGAFMRESEAHDKYNGVISYLAGVWFVMYFCAKDVAVLSVLALSFCDTAASTFGRLWGKYTPRIRKGKSLAGSIAACVVGAISALLFYVVIAPLAKPELNTGRNAFAFQDHLNLPDTICDTLNLTSCSVGGRKALLIVSILFGFVASLSEVVDLFGLDDNLTIPVLCGIGMTLLFRNFG